MADEQSIEALEKMEHHFHRLMDLLNEADQALREVRLSNDAFEKAHDMNKHKGTDIDDAITKIEAVLGQATNIHNEAVAHVRQAREEADQRSTAGDGS
jgi:chromosome segregation ATPase